MIVFMYVPVHENVHVCAHQEARDRHHLCQSFSTLFLLEVSLNLEPSNLARLDGQKAQGSSCPHLSSANYR